MCISFVHWEMDTETKLGEQVASGGILIMKNEGSILLVRDALAKCHKLGGLEETETDFSHSWRLEV